MIAWLRRYQRNMSRSAADPEDIVEFEEDTDPLPEQVYHDAARHYLDVQISSFDVLDARAGQIFSVGSVALPLTIALLNLGSNNVDIPTLAVRALQAGLFVYGGLLFCVVRAALILELEYRPDLSTLRGHSEQLPGAALLRWIANEYQESTQRNRKELTKKSRWVGIANIAFYIEGVLLSIAAFLTLT